MHCQTLGKYCIGGWIVVGLLTAACAPAAAPPATATVVAMPTHTAAPPPTAAAKVARLYSSFPLTGSAEAEALVHAIELAVAQAAAAGPLCAGRVVIDYVSLNDAEAGGQWSAALEMANAQQAAADPEAVAYLGPYNSGAARIAIPILNQAGLVMVNPTNTADDLTAGPEAAQFYPVGQRNYARVIARDAFQGAFGARWAAALGRRRVLLIADDTAYGQAIAEQFEAGAAQVGVEVLARLDVQGETLAASVITARVRAETPELIYYAGIAHAAIYDLVTTLRAEGLDLPVMGPDGLLVAPFAAALQAAVGEGVYSTIAGAPAARLPPAGQQFIAAYTARYHPPLGYAVYAYEAANVVLRAIADACTTERAAILTAVMQTRDFTGALGTWSFDAHGDTTLYGMLGYRVQDGVWVEVPAEALPSLP